MYVYWLCCSNTATNNGHKLESAGYPGGGIGRNWKGFRKPGLMENVALGRGKDRRGFLGVQREGTSWDWIGLDRMSGDWIGPDKFLHY
jgi:hypothetical protein